MPLLIPFGLRVADQRMVDVTAVAKGAKCGCVCPACGEALVAKKGESRVGHFAHTTACSSALETSIHQTAKQILKDLGYMWLPPTTAKPAMKFSWGRLEVEKSFGNVRPDAIAYSTKGRPLAIEIYVAHKVGEEKRNYLMKQGLSCVEYDLSNLSRDVVYEGLKSHFAEGKISADWVYNQKEEELRASRGIAAKRQRMLERIAEASGPRRLYGQAIITPKKKILQVGCPLIRPESSWEIGIVDAGITCLQCPHCVEINDKAPNPFVSCLGHTVIVPR